MTWHLIGEIALVLLGFAIILLGVAAIAAVATRQELRERPVVQLQQDPRPPLVEEDYDRWPEYAATDPDEQDEAG